MFLGETNYVVWQLSILDNRTIMDSLRLENRDYL